MAARGDCPDAKRHWVCGSPTRHYVMSRETNTQRGGDWRAKINTLAGILSALLGLAALFLVNTPEYPSAQRERRSLYRWADTTDLAKGDPEANASFLFIGAEQGEGWVAAPGNSSSLISFRQAGVIQVAVLPANAAREEAESSDDSTIPYGQGEVLCMEIAAAAFNISGPPRSCSRLTSKDAPLWVWSVHPKPDVAGEQVVSVIVTVDQAEGADAETDSSPVKTTGVTSYRTSRLLLLDVEKAYLDRYPAIVGGVLTALATVLGLLVKAILDRFWGGTSTST